MPHCTTSRRSTCRREIKQWAYGSVKSQPLNRRVSWTEALPWALSCGKNITPVSDKRESNWNSNCRKAKPRSRPVKGNFSTVKKPSRGQFGSMVVLVSIWQMWITGNVAAQTENFNNFLHFKDDPVNLPGKCFQLHLFRILNLNRLCRRRKLWE